MQTNGLEYQDQKLDACKYEIKNGYKIFFFWCLKCFVEQFFDCKKSKEYKIQKTSCKTFSMNIDHNKWLWSFHAQIGFLVNL